MASKDQQDYQPRSLKLLGETTVLPQNDRSVVEDSEFQENRQKLVNRSKLQYWWKSVSRVFNMIAAVLIPATIALITGGLVNNGTLTPNMITAVSIVGGVAVSSLAIGIATDYFENIVNYNQSFDMQDLAQKRTATHMAHAFDAVRKESPVEAQKTFAIQPQHKEWAGKVEQEKADAAQQQTTLH